MSTETEQKGLGIKPFEVLGYAISAIASAVLGSFFGFSGTVIGAGVASAISMVGAAVFQRGAEKTREAAKRAARNTGSARVQQPSGQPVQQQARPPSPQAPPPASGRSAPPGSPPASNQPDRATTSHRYPAVDPDRQIANLAAPLSEQPTRYLSPVGTADTASTSPAAGDAAPTDPDLGSGQIPWWRRHWKLLIGLFAVVFVIGIGGVSLIELASGGPLSGGSGGTSFGRLVGGGTSGTGDQPSGPQRPDQHPGGSDTTDTRQNQPDPTGQNPGPTTGQQPNQTAPETGGSAPNQREEQDQDRSGDQHTQDQDQTGDQGNNQDQGGDQKQNQQRERGQGQNPPGNQNQG